MAKESRLIWIGLAHVKNMGLGNRVGNAEGAEVYIAIRAESAEEFEHKVIAIFRQNRFQVFDIKQIENERDVIKDENDPIAAEKIALFKRFMKRETVFAWGNFYPYGER